MWLLMIIGQNLEASSNKFKQTCEGFFNFQVSRYVNFIIPNFQIFVILCELWVLWGMWPICEVPASVNEQSLMIKREWMCDHKRLWSCAFMNNYEGMWTIVNVEWKIVSIERGNVTMSVYICVMTMNVCVDIVSMNMSVCVCIMNMHNLVSLWKTTREHVTHPQTPL
jgi:hypothetical protein